MDGLRQQVITGSYLPVLRFFLRGGSASAASPVKVTARLSYR